MLSRVQVFAIPWTVAHQASLSLGFLRQEYWSGLPFSSPGDLPDPSIEPVPPVLAGGFFFFFFKSLSRLGNPVSTDTGCVYAYVCLVAQSCLTLCDPMHCIVHGILETRTLEWVASPFSRGPSRPRTELRLSLLHCRWTLYHLRHQGSHQVFDKG